MKPRGKTKTKGNRQSYVMIDTTTRTCYNKATKFSGYVRSITMQISSRFTIAIHIFSCINTFEKEHKITSDFLAGSVNVNPVIIRKLLLQLKAAGLVNVQRGSGGTSIARPLEDITLLDIYNAVECIDNGELFHFHENSNQECPVGRNIHRILDDKLQQVQTAMENEMKRITLADVIRDTQRCIQDDREKERKKDEL